MQIKCIEDRWIVENCDGESLGKAGEVEGAIKIARLLAATERASLIVVLAADGSTERTIDVAVEEKQYRPGTRSWVLSSAPNGVQPIMTSSSPYKLLVAV